MQIDKASAFQKPAEQKKKTNSKCLSGWR